VGYLEGLLGGFTGRKREVEQENLRQAERANTREADFYKLLIEHGTPEFQAMATTGLLESARVPQRKGGLRGWLGEMQENPTYSKVLGLINQPEMTGVETAVTPTSGAIPTPPSPSLAQSGTAATQVGAPPLTAIEPKPDESYAVSPEGAQRIDETVQAGAEPPAATAGVPANLPGAATISQRVGTQPRQVFRSPEEEIMTRYSAQERGELEGVIKTLTPYIGREAAVKQALEERQRSRGVGATGMQSIAGEMPDGTPAFGVFDRASGKYKNPDTGQPLEGFRPRTTTGSTSMGADRESIAREMFGKRPAQLTPEQMAQVNDRLLTFGGEKAGAVTAGRGEAAAAVPLSTNQRSQKIDELHSQWWKATESARKIQSAAAKLKVAEAAIDRGDLAVAGEAIIVTFERALDENSVVREAEARRPGTFSSLLTRIEGYRDRLVKGGATIPADELRKYVRFGQEVAQTSSDLVRFERQRITGQARSFAIEPEHIFGADVIGAPPPGAQTAVPKPPAAGGGLNAPVPGLFVDEAGNLVRR
jgi:hypothetical protein